MKEDNILSRNAATAANSTVPGAGAMTQSQRPSSEALLDCILLSLEDSKAVDPVSIGLSGKSEMADYMVICAGNSSRQVTSISERLTERLKEKFGLIPRVEGKDVGDWVLIDAGDVIVHVFRPEAREFYQLEKMWMSPGEAVAARN